MTTLYDSNGAEIVHHDLQDKQHWCRDGETLEQSFVRQFGSRLPYGINPEKITNPYAPDLINHTSNSLADLKVQATPFFKAGVLYQIEPTYAVVFNEKDKLRYEQNYPELEIVYWVHWLAVKAQIGTELFAVQPLTGIYMCGFSELKEYLKTLRIHYYRQRVNDTMGNAKGSYVLDIRHRIFKRLI
jgi:hypothetical protein